MDLQNKTMSNRKEDTVSLSFKTRGQKNPKGLPRVFFASHPDDRDRFLPGIWEMINKYQDIALFYEDEPLPWEELKSCLAEMQLIVMPVTTKLLTDENRARQEILPFANQEHIAVLPIMFESGLDDVFRKYFGDLQYLSPGNSDSTAIPFEQKLEKYLEGILVGSEITQRVRDAFDAYIFLSYRKKDRAYAQELMRLIHHNAANWNIAIWYDEFLVPGEDFNDAIQKALSSCNLFSMVVTPSLLERMAGEPNYIMREEYPAAKRAGKPIIPVEMSATDRNNLEMEFPEIPRCVQGRLADQLEGALEEHLGSIARREWTPEHHFLIGLAYLDGIDVEVDKGKALHLITCAAEDGMEEALRKLISMYHDGKGVARDYRRSIEWQERLIALLRKRCEFGDYEEQEHALISALRDLGAVLVDLEQPERARQYYEEMKAESEQLHARTGSGLRYVSISYEKLGDTEFALGNLAGAKRYHEKAFEISEQLAKETGTAESRRDLSIGYNKLGYVERAMGNLEEAGRCYEKALAIREELEKETGTMESRHDLLMSCHRLGNIEYEKGNPVGARMYYEKGLEIGEQLAEEAETAEFRYALTIIYDDLGDVERAMGNLDGARTYYEKDLKISEQLVKETGTIKSRRDLSVTYHKLGDLEIAQGKNPFGAKRYHRKALKIREQLVKEMGTVKSRRDLSASHVKLGNSERDSGNPGGAKICYERALNVDAQLAKETKTMESYDDLAFDYYRIGTLNITKSREYLEQAMSIWEELAEKYPSIARFKERRDMVKHLLQ